MKKQNRTIIYLAVFALICGCDDSQSPNAKFIQDQDVTLYLGLYTEREPQLDYWSVSAGEDGRDIYSASFRYNVKVNSYAGNVGVAGIRVDCYVEHCDPVYEDGRFDIWAKAAPNGEKYGFVRSLPTATARWDFQTGHASTKTNSEGIAGFCIGLGSPQLDPDGWEWPRGCNTSVLTGVKIKFVINKKSGPLTKECYSYFIRSQCADFWFPVGLGVFDVSFSSLQEAPASWPPTIIGDGEGTTSLRTKTAVSLIEENDLVKKDIPTRPLPTGFLPTTETGKSVSGLKINSNSREYVAGLWMQYVYNSGYGWYLDSPNQFMDILVSPDVNYPEDAVEILSICEPYVFFSRLKIEGGWPFDAKVHTVMLESKTAEGEVVSRLPLWVALYYADSNDVWTMSEYIVPIDSHAGEGRYSDWSGFAGTLVYMEENGYLEIKVNDFYGDFNFDDIVDIKDYAMLAEQWCYSVESWSYDLMYDAGGDGQTNAADLTVFVGNWSGNREYKVTGTKNLVDFAVLTADWMKQGNYKSDISGVDGIPDGFVDYYDLRELVQGWLAGQ